MNGYQQVQSAALAILQAEQLPAVSHFPSSYCLGQPLLAVGVGEGEVQTLGFCQYLGKQYDASLGAEVECYGRMLQLSLTVDAYHANPEDCSLLLEQSLSALLLHLPDHEVRPDRVAWGELRYPTHGEGFLRSATLQVCAYFTAQSAQEEPILLHFHLKGVPYAHNPS